jgi:hypothetical protein
VAVAGIGNADVEFMIRELPTSSMKIGRKEDPCVRPEQSDHVSKLGTLTEPLGRTDTTVSSS